MQQRNNRIIQWVMLTAISVFFIFSGTVSAQGGVATAEDGTTCGYVWMTSIQRRSFELFGHCLFLDMMKRMLNCHHWRYVGPIVLNGENKIETAAEGIRVHATTSAGQLCAVSTGLFH